MAKRELVYAARRKQTVYISLVGPQGRQVHLFTRSGYRADLLLTSAGYVEDNGKWRLRPSAAHPYQGLEDYLLAIVPHMRGASGNSDTTPLGRIAVYEIIVDEQGVPVKQRRKRDPWGATDPRFKAGHAVQSLPTRSSRKRGIQAKEQADVKRRMSSSKRKR